MFTNSKQKSSNNAKHKSLSDELDDLVNKAVNYVEKKLGRSLFNLSTTDENSNSEEEDSCDPESMIRTQNKCKVSNFDNQILLKRILEISFLRNYLALPLGMVKLIFDFFGKIVTLNLNFVTTV